MQSDCQVNSNEAEEKRSRGREQTDEEAARTAKFLRGVEASGEASGSREGHRERAEKASGSSEGHHREAEKGEKAAGHDHLAKREQKRVLEVRKAKRRKTFLIC